MNSDWSSDVSFAADLASDLLELIAPKSPYTRGGNGDGGDGVLIRWW